MDVRVLEAMAERTGRLAQLGSRLNISIDQGICILKRFSRHTYLECPSCYLNFSLVVAVLDSFYLC